MRPARTLTLLMAAVVPLTSCTSASTPAVVSPARGQTVAQMDRDGFECGLRAQEQTAADPGASLRDGALLGLLGLGAFGSALGAAIGAVTGSAGGGAVAGAIVGGAVGAPVGGSVKLAREGDARERAYRACLEARGYAVR